MFIRKLMMGLALFALAGFVHAFTGLEEGDDYAVISPAVSVADNGKVQVVELFWYGCPACYRLEPHLESWLKNKSDDIEFVRLPAIFNNPTWQLHAKAYYTAEVLGVVDDFHSPFFHAIHSLGKRMQSEAEIREFFLSLGVSGEKFDSTFSSFTVESRTRRAADLTNKYGITGVPALTVNGKFLVDGPMAKTYENMFVTINKLAEQESVKMVKR